VDVAAPYGTPVYAATDGIVAASTWSFAKGNYVEVRHAGGYSTAYYHLSEQSAGVNQRVRAGERIGRVGNTGSSTGAHLHFEIRINDTAVNPAGFIRALR
jgi:murein DD-endopeptidase MepM/ murein hydrolase activator NlpD